MWRFVAMNYCVSSIPTVCSCVLQMSLVCCPLPPDPGYEDNYNFHASATSEGSSFHMSRVYLVYFSQDMVLGVKFLLSLPSCSA